MEDKLHWRKSDTLALFLGWLGRICTCLKWAGVGVGGPDTCQMAWGIICAFWTFLWRKGWSAGFCHFWNTIWMCPACSVEVTSPWSFEEMSLILQKAHILEQNLVLAKEETQSPSSSQMGNQKSRGGILDKLLITKPFISNSVSLYRKFPEPG